MKKHIVSALSLALCLGLTVGSTVTVFAEDTKTIDSLKIAFSPYALCRNSQKFAKNLYLSKIPAY